MDNTQQQHQQVVDDVKAENISSSPTHEQDLGAYDADGSQAQGLDSAQGKPKRAGRRKINIEFIKDKSRRHITFSKRKAGIMKKAYELSTLTGTQVLLLVASETGHVYTFATPKLQPLITKTDGKNLIQACLNAPDMQGGGGDPSQMGGPDDMSGPGGMGDYSGEGYEDDAVDTKQKMKGTMPMTSYTPQQQMAPPQSQQTMSQMSPPQTSQVPPTHQQQQYGAPQQQTQQQQYYQPSHPHHQQPQHQQLPSMQNHSMSPHPYNQQPPQQPPQQAQSMDSMTQHFSQHPQQQYHQYQPPHAQTQYGNPQGMANDGIPSLRVMDNGSQQQGNFQMSQFQYQGN